MLLADKWQDYEILECGEGMKKERWGDIILVRPDPQIIWPLKSKDWGEFDAFYHRSKKGGGNWEYRRKIPQSWNIQYDSCTFKIRPTDFKHTGLFPEQAVNWDWCRSKIKLSQGSPKILNLFGYSGLASLHAASCGASVTHVDASKKAINYAFENRNLSSFQELPIKFITEDAVKFVNREIRRGNKYDGIILDPPKYGRGPNGEKWDLFNDLPLLLKSLPQILSNNPIFIILNSYAIRSSHISLYYGLSEVMKNYSGNVESGEISIVEDQVNPRQISTAIFARWEKR